MKTKFVYICGKGVDKEQVYLVSVLLISLRNNILYNLSPNVLGNWGSSTRIGYKLYTNYSSSSSTKGFTTKLCIVKQMRSHTFSFKHT